MGTFVIKIPFGLGETEALNVIRYLTQMHGHHYAPRLNTHEWAVAITSPAETDAHMAETYSVERRFLQV